MQKIKGSESLNLLSFECLRESRWKYCAGSWIFGSGAQKIRVISTQIEHEAMEVDEKKVSGCTCKTKIHQTFLCF